MHTTELYPPHLYRPDTDSETNRKRIQSIRRKRKHAQHLRRTRN